jgi:hypothetical protein
VLGPIFELAHLLEALRRRVPVPFRQLVVAPVRNLPVPDRQDQTPPIRGLRDRTPLTHRVQGAVPEVLVQ